MRHRILGLAIALVAVPMFLVLSTGVAAAVTPIALATSVSGTISAAGEADWYSVTTDTIGDLTVTQTAWPPYIETRIAVFGPNSQTLAQSNPVTAAAPGTYYLKVWSANDGVSEAVYTFNVTLTKAGTGNDIDKGGNSAAAAVPVTLGVAVSDTIAASKETAGVQDVDWFSVTTDTVGDLAVSQSAWPPYIETRIAVFGPNDATLAQGNPLAAAAPGTYYIKVWSNNDGSSIAPYTFNTSLTKAITGNDIDKGANSASGAVLIGLGVPVSDTIAPSKETAGKQDVDWFQVVAPVVGDLTVTQTEWPPYIETRIAVFGPNDPSLPLAHPVLNAAAGTYYIKVWSANDGSSITPYKFSVIQKGAPITVPPDAGLALPDAAVSPDAIRADAPIAVGSDAGAGIDGYRAPDTSGPTAIDAINDRDAGLASDLSAVVTFDGGAGRDAGVAKDSGAIAPSVDGGTGPKGPGQSIDAGETDKDSGGCSGCHLAGRSTRAHVPTVLFFLAAALVLVHRRRNKR